MAKMRDKWTRGYRVIWGKSNFKTGAFNHSATSPRCDVSSGQRREIQAFFWPNVNIAYFVNMQYSLTKFYIFSRGFWMSGINRLSQQNVAKKVGMFILALVLVGCATGEPYGTAKSKIPALQADKARIFVYRDINPLAIFKPRVFILDGKPIADTFASTIFYHDVTPGSHDVNFNGGRDKLAINIPAGGKIYIKYIIVDDSIAIGNTAVTVIDNKIAEDELTGVHLIETTIRNADEVK
jgi:hypothetical protein